MKYLFMFMAMVFLCAAPSSLSAAEVYFHEKGKCSGDWILLKEVARIDGTEAELEHLDEIYLGQGPEKGEPRMLTASYLQHRLEQFGFWGSPHKIVLPTHDIKVVRTDTLNRLDEVAFECEIRLAMHFKNVTKVEIDLEDPQDKLSSLPKGLLSVEVTNAKTLPRHSSANNLVLNIQAGDKRFAVTLKAQYRLFEMQVVTLHKLGTSREVREKDVELKECEIKSGQLEGYRKLDEVVGYKMRNYVPPRRRLKQGDVLPPLLIKKGDQVRLESQTKSMTIRQYGKALGDGRMDEKVKFMMSNGNIIYGLVTGDKTALLLGRDPKKERAKRIIIGDKND